MKILRDKNLYFITTSDRDSGKVIFQYSYRPKDYTMKSFQT